jgi:hypothetical protein
MTAPAGAYLWLRRVAGVVGSNAMVGRDTQPKIEAYKAKAAECFERAERLHNHPTYRQIYRDLAIQWLSLAAEAEYEERQD